MAQLNEEDSKKQYRVQRASGMMAIPAVVAAGLVWLASCCGLCKCQNNEKNQGQDGFKKGDSIEYKTDWYDTTDEQGRPIKERRAGYRVGEQESSSSKGATRQHDTCCSGHHLHFHDHEGR